ncbi:MAG: 2,3-diphosphoglycerate-dependent phosphoglycerate mutase [Candidatus Dasytiphilus stammeri]
MDFTKIVLLRHGESQWNKDNIFTGWSDIDLSKKGREEAKAAGFLLKKNGWLFDYAFTSLLKRAIHTLWILLDEISQPWLPIKKSWQLNERHYGRLQGKNKFEMIKKYGAEQIHKWRRDFYITPPALTKDDERFPGNDIRYAHLKINELPLTESLFLTSKRVIPYWLKVIRPHLQKGEHIIIVAHGNSLRALIKYLNNISTNEIRNLTIPTGIPLVYEFNKYLTPTKHYYLE